MSISVYCALHLISCGYNPFLEQLAWFIKKSKQFILNDIASDITALTLTLSRHAFTKFRKVYMPRTQVTCKLRARLFCQNIVLLWHQPNVKTMRFRVILICYYLCK